MFSFFRKKVKENNTPIIRAKIRVNGYGKFKVCANPSILEEGDNLPMYFYFNKQQFDTVEECESALKGFDIAQLLSPYTHVKNIC